jgi:uncharacterized protein (TIGR00369 family)
LPSKEYFVVERQPSSRSCFVCGRDNDVGLKMVWENHRDEGEIRSRVTVPEQYNGYPGVVHGGILAAMLDETAGRSVLMDGGPDQLMVTAKLEVVYRRPTPTDTPLLLVGRLVSRTETRAEARAEVRLPDGTVSARGNVLLARPPKEIVAGWEAEHPYFKVDG